MRWGNGEAALALTVQMGTMNGCGAWLAHGSKRAAEHVGKGSADFAVHVHGSEPAYHDSRFTSLMGVTYISDPTPGRHTAGSASWNETFGVGFTLPKGAKGRKTSVSWRGHEAKGEVQALYSNAHQAMNGLGLCMFTMLTGNLPWADLVNALTGWGVTEEDLLVSGERIQNLRNAFNRREGLTVKDFAPHPRMMGEGDGNLTAGPLKGVRVPLPVLRDQYHDAMHWNRDSGKLSRRRAHELGIDNLLDGYLEG
jgi:aldehyde:ferredoxin oxidoreductase